MCTLSAAAVLVLAWFVSESKDATSDSPSRENTAEVRAGRAGAMRMLRTYTVVVAEA